QMTECQNFLLQLGLSQYCANQLAMESLQRPDFDLMQLQQRWNRVKQLMGPQRQSEADTIVLREIQQLMQQKSKQLRARTPSPPREWRTSTPTTAAPMAKDVYNIDEDPRNIIEPPPREPQMNNNLCYPQLREESAYNIHEDPRDQAEDIPKLPINLCNNRENRMNDNCNRYPQQEEFNNNWNRYPKQEPCNDNWNYPRREQLNNNLNWYPQPEQPRPMHNYRDNYDGSPRDAFHNYPRQQNYDNRDNNNYNSNRNGHPREHRSNQSYHEDSGNETGSSTRHSNDRDNRRHNYNSRPYSQHQRQQELPPENDRYEYRSNHHGDYQVPKRRRVEEHPRQREFRIHEFTMPYIKLKKGLLPQPEHKSYAIGFYQRKRTFLAGGMRAIRKTDETEIPKPKIYDNPNRQLYKRIRRNLRMDWDSVYTTQEYSKWDLWWRGHKWCEVAIENELKRFEREDFNEFFFLGYKLNYKDNDAILKLIGMTHIAFGSNNDYYATLSIICELMNLEFLKNLKITHMGPLQDRIRAVPNGLWIYKMKAFLYLWARYSSIQCFVDTTISTEDNEVLATEVQWNRPLFHWMALEAFRELKRISAIEWPEH
ncbi:hypothetical protein KR093_008654, partial [Drosophila rubida]